MRLHISNKLNWEHTRETNGGGGREQQQQQHQQKKLLLAFAENATAVGINVAHQVRFTV